MVENTRKFKETEIGLIPEEWAVVKLADVARSVSDTFQFQGEDVIFLNTGDILEGKILHTNKSNPDRLPGQAKKRIRKNDILLSEIRPENKRFALVNIDASEYVVSTKLMVIRVKEHVLPAYLYILLTSPSTLKKFQILAESRSGTFPQITFEVIGSHLIALPSEKEQAGIANIVSTLDDKIELNRQINANLEKMASALFKRWFVDFEFPDENGKPYKSSGGKMVESEMGEIPEGWRMGKLGDEFEIVMGQSPEGSTYNEDGNGLPLYQGRTDFSFRFPSRRIYCTKPTRITKPMDTLISVRAPVGDINMANEECCIGRGVGAIRKNGFSSYTFYTIKSLQNQIAQFDSEGTIFGSINKESLSNISFIVPDMSVAIEFEKITCNTDEQIMTLSQEGDSLKSIRDSLLSRLMSGKIRVQNI